MTTTGLESSCGFKTRISVLNLM